MKRTIISLLLTGLLGASAGCSSFLDVENIGKSTIKSFFAEYNGLESAYYGIYHETYSFYDSYFVNYSDLASDLPELTQNASDMHLRIHNFESLPEDDAGYPRLLWKAGYNIVVNANNIIHYGPELKESNPEKSEAIDRIIAPAHFIRALIFFNLSNAYAQNYTYTDNASHLGIALPLQPVSFNDVIARFSMEKTYKQVLEDLQTAMTTLDKTGDSDVYYASGTACRALLARVYLYMGNYDLAEQYASEVIGKVSLTPYADYEMMFRYPDKNPGKETILRLNGYDNTSSLHNLYNPAGSTKVIPSAKLLALFDDPQDIRRTRLLHYNPAYEGYDDEEHSYEKEACMKYYVNDKYKIDNNGLNGHSDPFVLRCSEMYLIRAEALCNRENPDLDSAAADLKALIARATGKSISQIILTYSNQEEMNTLIERERMRELCFEGHRLLDISRRHQTMERNESALTTLTKLSYPDYRFVLPIPRLEIDNNSAMQQNPGYGGAEE